jgi:GNAT superfamily N-acetyltransferase
VSNADLSDTLSLVRAPEAESALRAFCCSKEGEIEAYARENALSDEATLMARTYVVLDGTTCVAYFTLLADAIRLDLPELPDGVRYLTAPAVKLARLGVSDSAQGRRIGEWILNVVVGLARTLSRDIGIRYVTLDALDRERLVRWYEARGFVRNNGEHEHRLTTTAEREIPLDVVSMRFDIIEGPIEGGTVLSGVVA